MQHTFLYIFCRSFVRLQSETSRNFLDVTRCLEEMSRRILVHFFFTAAHFHLALVAASISHFVTAATKFSCCPSNRKMSPLFFISRSRSLWPGAHQMAPAVALFLVELRWSAAYFLFFSIFLLI